MNTVLLQEILRYNNLLTILSNSLKDLIQALQGFQVMTSDLDSIAESIINNVKIINFKKKINLKIII